MGDGVPKEIIVGLLSCGYLVGSSCGIRVFLQLSDLADMSDLLTFSLMLNDNWKNSIQFIQVLMKYIDFMFGAKIDRTSGTKEDTHTLETWSDEILIHPIK